MTRKNRDYFEFEGIRFFPPKRKLERITSGEAVFLREKESDFLCILVENKRQIVGYDNLRTEIWNEYYSTVDETFKHNLQTTKNALLRHLQKLCDKNGKELIISKPNEGYCFLPEVIEVWIDTADKAEAQVSENPADAPIPLVAEIVENPVKQTEISSPTAQTVLSGHGWFLLTASFLYAALFVVALLLEVAYKFDIYGETALNIAPLVFIWIFVTSTVILIFGRHLTSLGQTGIGAAVLLLGFIISALILHFSLGFFLPDVPVTESNFQTQTAHSAYLKNICYFLPLAILYLLIPLHFVTAAERNLSLGENRALSKLLAGQADGHAPGGSIYLKLSWLVLLLFGAAVYSFFAAFNLLDNLRLSPYLDLFTQCLWGRALLYFSFGGLCLIWYSLALNDLRQRLLNKINFAENSFIVDENLRKQEVWFSGLVFIGMLIAGGLGFWVLRTNTVGSLPHLDKIEFVTAPKPATQFFIKCEGKNFDPETAKILVVGPGCGGDDPCVVPNGAITSFGSITQSSMEKVPLTVGVGEYRLRVRNGIRGTSNELKIAVSAN